MPWPIASFPWLVCLLGAWLLTGLFVTRGLLRLRDGIEVSALALPVGLLTHVLVGNALGYVMFLPFALFWLTAGSFVAGWFWLARAASREPLQWELKPRTRLLLLLGIAALGLGVLWLGQREYFGDDSGHGTMTHLMAAGHFPLRFQCNPALRAAYAYGGNLVGAQIMVVAGLRVWDAIDLAKSVTTASVALLAFLAGYRPARRVGAGLLAVLLLFTIGPMVWIYLPFAGGGLAYFASQTPGLADLPPAMGRLLADPWTYAIASPGFITPQFAHAHRALAWSFAPFQVLLFLALLEAPLTRTRRTLALGVVLGATALMQAAALMQIGLGFAGYWLFTLLRRRQPPSVLCNVPAVLALAGVLLAVQGGPITDSLHDRLEGVVNPTTDFQFKPPILPSCRKDGPSVPCALLSIANLGLAPFLLPWLALALWRRGPRVRLVLALGCATAYAFPFLFRYGYIDWNIQRSISYATWTVGVLLAPLLYERLAAGGARRAGALAILLVGGWGGLTQLGVIVDGRWAKDGVGLDFWQLGPLDERLAPLASRLPLGAVIFDRLGCLNGTSCRPALIFGRYAGSSPDRLAFRATRPEFQHVLQDPDPAVLRQAGFTHVYVDALWLRALRPEARARLTSGPFEVLGLAQDERDLRALLRVCRPDEGCRSSLPDPYAGSPP